MNALPIEPTERDRERFEVAVAAMTWSLFTRDSLTNEYTDFETANLFKLWWSVERERQLLQNLNQSQGVKISELLARAEKAESEIEAERKRLDWALDNTATFYDWQGKNYLSYDIPKGDKGFDVLETDNPRATIDELIAGDVK